MNLSPSCRFKFLKRVLSSDTTNMETPCVRSMFKQRKIYKLTIKKTIIQIDLKRRNSYRKVLKMSRQTNTNIYKFSEWIFITRKQSFYTLHYVFVTCQLSHPIGAVGISPTGSNRLQRTELHHFLASMCIYFTSSPFPVPDHVVVIKGGYTIVGY